MKVHSKNFEKNSMEGLRYGPSSSQVEKIQLRIVEYKNVLAELLF